MNKNHIPLTVATRQPWWEPREQELRDEERKRWGNLGVRESTPKCAKQTGAKSGLGMRGKGADDPTLLWVFLRRKAGG